jgi:alpha-mannosidase
VVEAERPAGLDGELRPLPETVPLRVRTVVRLVRGSRRVEFRTTIDNTGRDHRLRVVFAVEGVAETVRAEGHFAVVRRPLAPTPPRADWVEPPDATQHTLGAVSLGSIAVITKGLPEYEARADGERAELCITLLRCVGLISQRSGVLATRPQAAGPGLRTPEGQCPGRHQVDYALLTDADTLDDAALLRESHDYRRGFLTVPARVELSPPLALAGDVIFSCLKGAEDGEGLILRCFNPFNSSATARVTGRVIVSQTRLDETGDEPLPDGSVRVAPGQVATLRLRRS